MHTRWHPESRFFPTGANGMSSHYGAPEVDRTVMTAELRVELAQSGPGWKVVIQLASDRLQYISGFDSEQAARDWIINQSQDWFCRLSAGL
jgi:hypothetical protein